MVDRIRATRLNDLNPTLDRCIPDLEVARPNFTAERSIVV
jgi:hypothetical protein